MIYKKDANFPYPLLTNTSSSYDNCNFVLDIELKENTQNYRFEINYEIDSVFIDNLLKEKQAVAAVGQCELMHIYSKFFGEYSHVVGQVLLTRDVVEDDHIRENVVNTFETLIENKVIPIVNENDTVAIDEIENIVRFGDNDNLSAIVAGLVSADLLIILSDIDGFYDSDPRKNPDSKMIKEVIEITKELEECAGGAGTSFGTGGMATKLTAAKTATRAGVDMVLANGDNPKILFDIVNGEEIGTLFIKN